MTSEPQALFDYQKEGVNWLVEHYGGFLWDQPGLGKTRQAIYAALSLGGPILIVCPNSLKRWWVREIKTVQPTASVLAAGVAGRFKHYEESRTGRLLKTHEEHIDAIHRRGELPLFTIVHYAGMRLAREHYAAINWSVVVADEAHYIKNPKAERTKALMDVTPKHAARIGLTATPWGGLVADLWSQLRWSAPTVKKLHSYWRFYNTFVDYEWEINVYTGHRFRRVKGAKNTEALAMVMHTYGLQRTKAQVAPQLPPIIDTTMPIEMTRRQQTVYKKLASKAVEVVIKHGDGIAEPARKREGAPDSLGGVRGRRVGQSKTDVFLDGFTGVIIKNTLSQTTKIERWLSCPWEYDPSEAGAKLEWVLEWAETTKEPAVIVTRFRSSAVGVAKALGCRAIHGEISQQTRDRIVEAWQKGEVSGGDRSAQFLVGTINTLGTGLNLQRAYTMICYDQVQSPIQMGQVRERVHRITTDHNVQVIYLCIENSTNEVILEAFQHKWTQLELISAMLKKLQESSNGEGTG